MAGDLGYVDEKEMTALVGDCRELGRQLFSLAKSLQRSSVAGTRYKASTLKP